jgi:glucoamylase
LTGDSKLFQVKLGQTTMGQLINAEPERSKFSSISKYMFWLMLRNFATRQWVFSKPGREPGTRMFTLPGCIIASPSRPHDAETTEDYVHFWVRDGALTVNECVYHDLPTKEMLDDYVSFSYRVQETAIKAGRGAHACFNIDGTERSWGEQGDGPGLRILSILEIWDQLSEDAKSIARKILVRDRQYIIDNYDDDTDNAWEEITGKSFFSRTAQRQAIDKLEKTSSKTGIDPEEKIPEIIKALTTLLEEHWASDLGYYRSILNGKAKNGALRGHELNIDIVFACTYNGLPCFDERMLATVAKLRDKFEKLYPINEQDQKLDIGPLIGRYPGDMYDGTVNQGGDMGHPWPLCTANLGTILLPMHN